MRRQVKVCPPNLYFFLHIISGFVCGVNGGPEKGRFLLLVSYLPVLAADASGKLHVLWHDGDAFGVDGTEVGVLEETDHP